MLWSKWSLASIALALSIICAAVPASAQGERALPMNPALQGGDVYFNSSIFQANIRSEAGLGTLAKQHPGLGDQELSFGFAAKSMEAKFLMLGMLYSEALAYLSSGQFDDAARQLAAIEQECINLQVPSALYNYLSRTRNMIERQQYSIEVLKEFLALLQPFLDDYARSQGADKHTLFRAGTWLEDLTLAAAGQDTTMLRQSVQAHYFSRELKQLNAPKGVLEALNRITRITEQQEIRESDAAEILKLVKQIQTLLA